MFRWLALAGHILHSRAAAGFAIPGIMKWLLYLVILLALLIGAVFLIGYALPANTTSSRSITLQQPPAAVFAVLADVKNLPQWNRNTEKMAMLPPVDGREATPSLQRGA